MLRINLLPEDRRTSDRTPLPRFLVLLVGVAVITGELAVGFYGYMKLRNLNAIKKQKQEKRDSLKKHVKTFEKLQKDIKVLQRRKKILDEISPGDSIKEKYQWSYAIDKLFTVIDESPGVWVRGGLNGSMLEGGGRGAGSGLTLSFQASSATYMERMTNFTEWIKKKLVEEEKVFTSLERDFRSLTSSETGKKTLWQTEYKLLRRPGEKKQ